MIQTADSIYVDFQLKEKEYFDLKSSLRSVSASVLAGAKRAMDRTEEAWMSAMLSEAQVVAPCLETTYSPGPQGRLPTRVSDGYRPCRTLKLEGFGNNA